jgi:hypothetical protein
MQHPSAASELKELLSIPPPNFHSTNAHAIAHAALEALRDAGDERFLFLRTLLELFPQSDEQEILFHCLTGLRQVLLKQWGALSSDFVSLVRDYLMSMGHQTGHARTIQIACYTTAAAFWKRQWGHFGDDVEDTSPPPTPQHRALADIMFQKQPVRFEHPEQLFHHLETMTDQGALFLSILVGEFSGKSSAVQYCLPLEFHIRAHASFEKGWLTMALRLSMGALSLVVLQLTSGQSPDHSTLDVVHLVENVLSWEFGTAAWDSGIVHNHNSKTLLRPPLRWQEYLIRPDLVGAMFHVHQVVRNTPPLAHAFRQLLLLLASLGEGPIFTDDEQRKAFCTHLTEGTLQLLITTTTNIQETSELLDSLSIVSRLIANFKLSLLVSQPSLVPLLSAMTNTGTFLLQANVQECEAAHGDTESMENREWREEVLALILESCVLLSGDPWLLYSGNEESRKVAQSSLSNTLAPLYNAFLSCRIKMARMEEYYLTSHAEELEEVREEISAADLAEEMTAVASLGRLNLGTALECISMLFQPVLQNLETLWNSPGLTEVNAESAAILEEVRLLTLSLGHLLTDDNSGETPVIPESIIISCQGSESTTNSISSAVQSILAVAQVQAAKIVANPHDTTLSPLLASTFLWFLNRWAPAYILPVDYGSTDGEPSPILAVWGPGESANQVSTFCATLCLHYQCYWPREKQVQENATALLLHLANRGDKVRALLVESRSFQQMASLHCVTAGLAHGASVSEAQINANHPNISSDMAHGYQRLSYGDRSKILTAMLAISSDKNREVANTIFNHCLQSVETALKSYLEALSHKRIDSQEIHAKEMAGLCVELYVGIARTSEWPGGERVVRFLTPALQDLSGLMTYYAQDLSICESLLRFFRDYTERFVAILDREQSLTLFNATADLLRHYSATHCAARIIVHPSISPDEEEQQYSDVLCAIELLTQLGTKEFFDICSSTDSRVKSGQVTDMIFYGLQQIIPLMTQGLLQYPSLCSNYFDLVGFMTESYADKVCALPYDLFDALWESVLFGMSHLDSTVGKDSLLGIASIVKAHLESQALATHLASHPDIFDKCSRRLLQEVIFRSVVWDRLEASGMAMLPLAAANVNRFAAVVQGLQVPQVQASFEKLIQPQVLSKVTSGGYEGRANRVKFTKDFEVFVKEVHSLIVTV